MEDEQYDSQNFHMLVAMVGDEKKSESDTGEEREEDKCSQMEPSEHANNPEDDMSNDLEEHILLQYNEVPLSMTDDEDDLGSSKSDCAEHEFEFKQLENWEPRSNENVLTEKKGQIMFDDEKH